MAIHRTLIYTVHAHENAVTDSRKLSHSHLPLLCFTNIVLAKRGCYIRYTRLNVINMKKHGLSFTGVLRIYLCKRWLHILIIQYVKGGDITVSEQLLHCVLKQLKKANLEAHCPYSFFASVASYRERSELLYVDGGQATGCTGEALALLSFSSSSCEKSLPDMFRSALRASRSETVFAGDMTAGLDMNPFS